MELGHGAAGPDGEVRVHSCSRVGMAANPPGPRLPLGSWLLRRGSRQLRIPLITTTTVTTPTPASAAATAGFLR